MICEVLGFETRLTVGRKNLGLVGWLGGRQRYNYAAVSVYSQSERAVQPDLEEGPLWVALARSPLSGCGLPLIETGRPGRGEYLST